MDVQQALQKYLTEDDDCRRTFGPRIFEGGVPTKAEYPLVQYSVLSNIPDMSLSGEIGTATARITYTVGADTLQEATSGQLLIRNRLNGVNFVNIEGVDVQHILLQEPGMYEVEQPPDTGEEFPPYAWAAEYEVYYNLDANDPEQGSSSSGGGGGGGGGVDPDPEDPTLPAWPAFTASAEMVESYGDTGPWDVGASGLLTYATPAIYWFADSWFTWYAYLSDGTVTDPINGTPDGIDIFNGTLDRIHATQPGSAMAYYTTMLRVRTSASFAEEGAWPRTGAVLTSDYDPSWILVSPSDAYAEEKEVLYTNADCREVHGREWARGVAEMKELHPRINRVYSDNWAMPQSAPTVDWTALCLMAGSALESMRAEFGVAVPLIPNVTTKWQGDLTADLDTAADNEIAGWHNEGLCHEHFMTAAEFTNIVANQQYWFAKTWPGGGRRYFGSNARSDTTSGLNRIVTVQSVAIVGNTLEVTCTTPHRLSDTSVWNATPSGVHASLNGTAYSVTRTTDSVFTINFAPSAPPASGYSLGTFCFTYSGHDVDAGWLHSIRQDGDNVRSTHVHGSADARGYCTPLWRTWQSIYGYATGAPEIVSTHSVDFATYGGSGTVTCVKEIRTPFAGGWYLHVDFSIAERRAWWVNGS
jgi:hypothetical protein